MVLCGGVLDHRNLANEMEVEELALLMKSCSFACLERMRGYEDHKRWPPIYLPKGRVHN